MLLQKVEEHSPDVLRLRGPTTGLHDMTHDLVDDVEVALSHRFRLLRKHGDCLPAPFFKRGTVIVARRKLEIVCNLGWKVGGTGGEDVSKNGLARCPCDATSCSDICPIGCYPPISSKK